MVSDPAVNKLSAHQNSLRSILLVEDNACDAELTTKALRKAHVANPISLVEDGEAALAYLLQRRDIPSELPIVVLLDLQLPKVNGLDVLRKVRQENGLKDLPVVVMTSSQDQEDVLQSYSLGAESFVRKPIEMRRFSSVIATLGINWLLIRSPKG